MCHICKVTGDRECDPQAAEIKCMICGFCEAQALKKQAQDEGYWGGEND